MFALAAIAPSRRRFETGLVDRSRRLIRISEEVGLDIGQGEISAQPPALLLRQSRPHSLDYRRCGPAGRRTRRLCPVRQSAARRRPGLPPQCSRARTPIAWLLLEFRATLPLTVC